jgi:hypothetical protein
VKPEFGSFRAADMHTCCVHFKAAVPDIIGLMNKVLVCAPFAAMDKLAQIGECSAEKQ